MALDLHHCQFVSFLWSQGSHWLPQEGIASCVAALLAYIVLIDLPENGKYAVLQQLQHWHFSTATKRNFLRLPAFLEREEAAIIIAHIERDRGDAQTENFGLKQTLSHLKDWRCWEFASFVMLNVSGQANFMIWKCVDQAQNVALYAFSFFLPFILKSGFGYSTAKANLFAFPPYAVAIPVSRNQYFLGTCWHEQWMIFTAWFNDKFHTRGPMMVFNCILYITGLSMWAISIWINYADHGWQLQQCGLPQGRQCTIWYVDCFKSTLSSSKYALLKFDDKLSQEIFHGSQIACSDFNL